MTDTNCKSCWWNFCLLNLYGKLPRPTKENCPHGKIENWQKQFWFNYGQSLQKK